MEVCPYGNEAICVPSKCCFHLCVEKNIYCIAGCGLTGLCFSDHTLNINYQPQRGYDTLSVTA